MGKTSPYGITCFSSSFMITIHHKKWTILRKIIWFVRSIYLISCLEGAKLKKEYYFFRISDNSISLLKMIKQSLQSMLFPLTFKGFRVTPNEVILLSLPIVHVLWCTLGFVMIIVRIAMFKALFSLLMCFHIHHPKWQLQHLQTRELNLWGLSKFSEVVQ